MARVAPRVSSFLIASRDLIGEEKYWTIKKMERMRWFGFAHSSYCMVGALRHTLAAIIETARSRRERRLIYEVYGKAVHALYETLCPMEPERDKYLRAQTLMRINDSSTYRQVMRIWDRTIDRVLAEENGQWFKNLESANREVQQEEEGVLVG